MGEQTNATACVLTADNVTVRFGGLTALDDVSFGIDAGEILGVIGPNGAGKSTLINVVTGIYRPSAGQLAFSGRQLGKLKPHQAVRLGIARTFQNSRLFTNLSVLDNVLIGMHTQMRGGVFDAVLRRGRAMRELRDSAARAEAILASLGEDLVDRLHSSAGDLAHADKRRVEIARALAAKPRLLLLDEPSAGMGDDETSRLIDDIKGVQREYEGLSVMIIEHDMDLMRRLPDRVMVLNYGECIATGSFAEVSSVDAVKTAYLGAGH